MRLVAFLALALLAGYHAMRIVATGCSGPRCDVYIPLSLLLPLAVLIADTATGIAVTSEAWLRTQGAANRLDRRREAAWLVLLIVCMVVSVGGPLASLAVFRDNPDAFVLVATALVALLPVVALIYSFVASAPAGSPRRS